MKTTKYIKHSWIGKYLYLPGVGFKYFLIFTPKLGEDFQFDDHIFQMGWFNHQPAYMDA